MSNPLNTSFAIARFFRLPPSWMWKRLNRLALLPWPSWMAERLHQSKSASECRREFGRVIRDFPPERKEGE